MYTEKQARELVLKAGIELVEKKLIARTWGNISARISDEEFIITPSGRAYETLKISDLVKVRISDLSYEGDIKPSSEKGIHASCYKLRKDCNFVIHTHQFYASAICAEETHTPFAPCAKYALAGTGKLINNMAEVITAFPNCCSFLMAKHGALLLGSTYEDAFEKADKLELQCKELFEKEKHTPLKGAYIDDYAQMFNIFNKPNEGEDQWCIDYLNDKNTAAASYVKNGGRIPLLRRILEHYVYTKKYSKLKQEAEK